MRACVVVVGLALLAFAAARCPNSCSGHGDCGAADVCSCWANWQGYDCSERTCAYDIAWATNYRQDAHYYAECSNAGICDRTTGECVCFDGFTGVACKRTVCPNDCSGHGKCRLVAELPEATQAQFINPQDLTASSVFEATIPGGTGDDLANAGGVGFPSDNLEIPGSAYPYYNWDGDKIQACLCDGEFFGPDCSLRHCPTGDDPLTTCPEQNVQLGVDTPSPAYDAHQVQVLTISSSSAGGSNLFSTGTTGILGEVSGDIVLHYTDAQGQVWTTSAISLSSGTVTNNIISALTALPNYKIPSVKVTAGSGSYGPQNSGSAASSSFFITFTDERNSGNQELLACDPLPLGCVTAGCSPLYAQPQFWKIKTSGAFGAAAITTGSFASEGAAEAAFPLTADSIFDNSAAGANIDQASFAVHISYANGALYPTYYVNWDYSGLVTGAAPTANTLPGAISSCTPAGDINTCQWKYIPSGYVNGADTTHNAMPSGVNKANDGSSGSSGTLANGVGFNRVPVGNGLYITLPDAYATLGASTNTAPTANTVAILIYQVATVQCSVQEYLRSDPMYENEECSGRGACDYTSGTCNCFEGFYGDHCSLQTILV